MYGGDVWAYTNAPYIYFGDVGVTEDDDDDYISLPLDLKRQHRGRRWAIDLEGYFYETTDATPGAGVEFGTADIMKCLVCFDVKKEDAELKEGHKGIGACAQYYLADDQYFG